MGDEAARHRLTGEFVDAEVERGFMERKRAALIWRVRTVFNYFAVAWSVFVIVDVLTLSGRDLALAVGLRGLCLLHCALAIWVWPKETVLDWRRAASVAVAGFYAFAALMLAASPSELVSDQGIVWICVCMCLTAVWGVLRFRVLLLVNSGWAVAGFLAWSSRDGVPMVESIAGALALAVVLVGSLGIAGVENATLRAGHVQLLRIEALMSAREQLLAAVAHELRTPLARFRMSLALIKLEPTAELFDQAERHLDDVKELIAALLQYGALAPGERCARPDELDAATLVDEVVDLTRALAGDKRLTCDVDDAPLQVHRELLRSALANLVTNALRHAAGRVRVTARRDVDAVVFTVDDDGPGIPPGKREVIFDPLQRLDEARARDTGGVGLGLAITRRIAEAHGGSVRAEDSDLGGARFLLRIPDAHSL